MAIQKLIKQNANGTLTEYSGINASAGVGSADEIPRLDASGKLDTTFLPVGVGQDSVIGVAGENLSAGNLVYFDVAGQVLRADATAIGKQAHGYVLSAVTSGSNATVFFDDSNSSLTGLTAGSTYYLDTIAGAVTTTPTTTSGQIVQEVGFATSTTNLRVNIQKPIVRL